MNVYDGSILSDKLRLVAQADFVYDDPQINLCFEVGQELCDIEFEDGSKFRKGIVSSVIGNKICINLYN